MRVFILLVLIPILVVFTAFGHVKQKLDYNFLQQLTNNIPSKIVLEVDSLLNTNILLETADSAELYLLKGNALKNLGNFEESQQNLIIAARLFEKKNNYNSLSTAIAELGNVYLFINQPKLALENFNEAVTIATNNQITNQLPKINAYKAAAFGRLSKFNEAKKILFEILKNENLDEKTKHLVYSNLGINFGREQKLDSSIFFLEKTLKFDSKMVGEIEFASSLINLGNAYYLTDQFEKAENFYRRAKAINQKYELQNDLVTIYFNLSNLFHYIDRYDSAFTYLMLHDSLKEELLNLSVRKQINQLQVQFDTEKKQQQIKNQQIVIQKEKSEKRLLFISLLAAAFFIIIFVFIIFWYKQRAHAQKIQNEQTKKIHQQEVNEILGKQEIETLNAMMSGQENERKRVSKDLHDRVGSLLSTLKLYFSDLTPQSQLKPDKLESLKSLLNESISEVRKISHNLASGILERFGLIAALNDLVHKINNAGKVKAHFFTEFDKLPITSMQEVELYRIAQEVISNTLKHAQATNINLQLFDDNKKLIFSVEDDGIGFKNNNNQTEGIGLKNIKQRAQSIGAQLFIDSQLNKGTFVQVILPY